MLSRDHLYQDGETLRLGLHQSGWQTEPRLTSLIATIARMTRCPLLQLRWSRRQSRCCGAALGKLASQPYPWPRAVRPARLQRSKRLSSRISPSPFLRRFGFNQLLRLEVDSTGVRICVPALVRLPTVEKQQPKGGARNLPRAPRRQRERQRAVSGEPPKGAPTSREEKGRGWMWLTAHAAAFRGRNAQVGEVGHGQRRLPAAAGQAGTAVRA